MEHPVALVKDGARLADAARVYGISAERVRQLLKEAGMSASDLPGRGEKSRTGDFGRARELAPVIEAMWREGMLYHEIAVVLDMPCEPVHRVVCERVPKSERAAHIAGRLHDGRACDARLGAGGLSRSTIGAYLLGSSLFVRWLAGDRT